MYRALQELGNAQQEAGRAHKAAEAKAREAGPSAPSNLHEAQARLAGMNSSFLLSSQHRCPCLFVQHLVPGGIAHPAQLQEHVFQHDVSNYYHCSRTAGHTLLSPGTLKCFQQ